MKERPWESEFWNVSRMNYWPCVYDSYDLPEKVIFHDATLRDGEQTPGVVFTIEDKLVIAKQLAKIGVQRIEVGMPAVSDQDFEAARQIAALDLSSQTLAFSRAVPGDIEKVVASGVQGAVIEITCGESRLKYANPNWTIDDVVRKSVDTIKYAKKAGLYTVYFPYDTTRSEAKYCKELIERVCEEADPDAVTVVDTTGTATPNGIKALVRNVKEYAGGRPIEIHTHNDLGMGVANALAAVEAGAQVVHGCINGIGERCGNASLEQIVVALETLYGIHTGIDTTRFVETCKMVERLSGVAIPYNMPIAGTAAYMKESGVGINVATKFPQVTFPISEKYVGASRKIVLGKKSGKESIHVKLEELGLHLEEGKISTLLSEVKNLSIQERRLITDREFESLYHKVKCSDRSSHDYGDLESRGRSCPGTTSQSP